MCYLDDVIVFGRDFNEHYNRLKTVLERLRVHGLRVKPEKCTIAARQVSFLGHVISDSGIMPDPAKIEAVNNISSPHNIKDLRSFLGLAGYYRKFIPGFSSIAAPCTSTYPDFGKNFVLQTDAYDYGVGAVLSQLDDSGNEKVIAYASKALSPREQKYSTTEKEALAVVFGTGHFRVHLLGRNFKLITDHNTLRWLHTMEAKGRLARWVMDLQEFDFSVVHRAGRIHNNADALSRLVQTNLLDSGTTTPAEQNHTFVSTIRVKLSKGRTAIVKLESNKPLIVDPDVNTHDHHSTNGPSSQEGNKIDAITLHPTMNLRDGQRMDPHLAYIIDLKTRKLPKPNLKQIKDPALKKWLRHYDQYFLHDEILYRAPDHKSNSPTTCHINTFCATRPGFKVTS